jgi:HEAT repeat protein
MKWNRALGIASRLAVLFLVVAIFGWVWNQSGTLWQPSTAVSPWLAQARSGNSEERRYAISMLGSARPIDFQTVLPAIVEALHDRASSVRNEAALALWRYLAESLKTRGSAMIGDLRLATRSLIVVIEQDSDPGVRATAAFAAASLLRELTDLGITPSRPGDPLNRKTLAEVISTTLERDLTLRQSLLVPFSRLGPLDEPAPKALVAALDDPSRVVRIEALLAISQFASGVDNAVTVILSDALSAPAESHFNRGQHIYPLRQAAERMQPSAAVLPLLIDALHSQSSDARELALVLLRHLGPAGRPAAQSILAVTQSMIQAVQRGPEDGEDPLFAEFASTVVQIAPPEDTISLLSEALDRSHPTLGAHAAWFLGKLGSKGACAVPLLLQALKDAGDPPQGRLREEYVHAILRSLWDIAPSASLPEPMAGEVIEVLSKALDYPQNFIRRTAADALGAFGGRAAAAAPRLRALGENASAPRDVREAAALALQRIFVAEHAGGS